MASQVDTSKAVETLFKQLHDVTKGKSFQLLEKVASENAELRKKRDNWEATNDNNLESIANLKQQIKDGTAKASSQIASLNKLKEENKQLLASLTAEKNAASEAKKQIATKDSELSKLNAKVAKAEATSSDLKKQKSEREKSAKAALDDKAQTEKELSRVCEELSEKSAKLQKVEDLKMKLEDLQEEELRRHLSDIFDSLDAMVRTHIGDINGEAVDREAWQGLAAHAAFKQAHVPMMLTNTPSAKCARRAVVLSVCAWALEQHIFQSTHLIDHDNQLSMILDDLAHVDPEREKAIRSILLRLQHERPKDKLNERSTLAVKTVVNFTDQMLTEDSRDVFVSSLEKIFLKADGLWKSVQTLKRKIVASRAEKELDDWSLMSSTHLSKDSPEKKSNGKVGAASSTRGSVKQAPDVPEADEALLVIWPAFLTVEEGYGVIFAKGYAIPDSDFEAARHEYSQARAEELLKAEEERLWESRRESRKNSRDAAATTKRRPSLNHGSTQLNGKGPFLGKA